MRAPVRSRPSPVLRSGRTCCVESDASVRIDCRSPSGVSGISDFRVSSRSCQSANGARATRSDRAGNGPCGSLANVAAPCGQPGRGAFCHDLLDFLDETSSARGGVRVGRITEMISTPASSPPATPRRRKALRAEVDANVEGRLSAPFGVWGQRFAKSRAQLARDEARDAGGGSER